MSKFVDAIKGFINKHFTQEVVCANCGKTGKIMFFTTLGDGNKICGSCKRTLPSEFKFEAKDSDLAEFQKLYQYIQYSKTQLEPNFKPDRSYSYGTFEVDPFHELARIGGSFVFELKNVTDYCFNFKAEDFKDGIFNPRVKGDVYLNYLFLENPYAAFSETIIKFGAKGKAEKPLFSSTILYQNPPAMDEFLMNFGSIVSKYHAQKEQQALEELVEKKARELLEQREKEGKE